MTAREATEFEQDISMKHLLFFYELCKAGMVRVNIDNNEHAELILRMSSMMQDNIKSKNLSDISKYNYEMACALVLRTIKKFIITDEEEQGMEQSVYEQWGIDIKAIQRHIFMSEDILARAEKVINSHLHFNGVIGFKLSKKFADSYSYKKIQHLVTDWLESVHKTGSLAPLDNADNEVLQWLDRSSKFQVLGDIRGITSLILSGAYDIICPPPSKTNADRFQLGRWYCQKELVLNEATDDIVEFANYLREKVKEA